MCRFICAGEEVGATCCQGVSREGSNRLCVCAWGYAEEGECNHPGLCCYLTLRLPMRMTFQAVWPSQVVADYFTSAGQNMLNIDTHNQTLIYSTYS